MAQKVYWFLVFWFIINKNQRPSKLPSFFGNKPKKSGKNNFRLIGFSGVVRIYDLKSNYSLAEIPVINNLNLITNKLVLSNN